MGEALGAQTEGDSHATRHARSHGAAAQLERDISAVARRLRRLRLLPRRHDVRQLADETQRINLVIMLPGRKTPATADVEGHLSLPPIGKCAWIVTAKPSRLHQLHQPHPAPAGRGAGRAAGDAAARVYRMTCKHSHCAYVPEVTVWRAAVRLSATT